MAASPGTARWRPYRVRVSLCLPRSETKHEVPSRLPTKRRVSDVPYVLFDSRTFEVHSAVTGPEPVPPTVNLRPGEVPDIQLEGALKNYVFIPEGPLPSARLARGRVEQKLRKQWDVEHDENARGHHHI